MAKQIRNFVGLALLLAASSGFAQVQHAIRFRVPFSFMAAGRSWAAGDYRMQFNTDTGFVTLSSFGINSATVMTSPGDPSREIGYSHLRFQSDGEHWILREVLVDGKARILRLKKSERELLEAGLLKSREQRDVASVSRGTN
jgi:hypothetical protein